MAINTNNPQDPTNTRRWPRFPAQLPVIISVETEVAKQPVPGLASEISRSGMSLYGGVQVEPGDRMEVEFQTSGKPRVTGIVRNRSGFCFGLEFPALIGTSRTAQAEATWAEDVLGVVGVPDETVENELPQTGFRSWLAAHRGSAVAIGTALLLLAALMIGVVSAQHSLAQPRTPTQSLTLFERMLIGFGMAEAPPDPLVPTGNPSTQVWVDPHTALYYCAGAELYGKTPDGRFEAQRDAQLDQFQPAARKSCE